MVLFFDIIFKADPFPDKTSLINQIYKELNTNTQVKNIFNPLTKSQSPKIEK